MRYQVLTNNDLTHISGGSNDGFWYQVGNIYGAISGSARDAGWNRAHRYGGRTKY